MKSETIDSINIWLLVFSFTLAIYLPFELFLFSYAILGPLHYLTEINWLNDRAYFVKSKSKNYLAFVVFAIFLSFYPLLYRLELNVTGFFKTVLDFLLANNSVLFFAGFVFSVGLIFFTKTKHLILVFIGSLLISMFCNHYISNLGMAIGVFLPTIIHVYVFTLLFMVYGQIKSFNNRGLICIVMLIAAPILIILFDFGTANHTISDFTKDTYTNGNLLTLNAAMANLFADLENNKFFVLSPLGVKIQIFIAFAYTYHYLNWFSKTSIIGWKKSLNSKRIMYILFLWLSAVAIYIYDYGLGLKALFFLSLLHVILEFPLNVITIKELFSKSYQRLTTRFR